MLCSIWPSLPHSSRVPEAQNCEIIEVIKSYHCSSVKTLGLVFVLTSIIQLPQYQGISAVYRRSIGTGAISSPESCVDAMSTGMVLWSEDRVLALCRRI